MHAAYTHPLLASIRYFDNVISSNLGFTFGEVPPMESWAWESVALTAIQLHPGKCLLDLER